MAALKLGRQQREIDREHAGDRWMIPAWCPPPGYGTPIEPRNFIRSFDQHISKAKVHRITVHGTRRSCGSLLAALDVHPRVAMQIPRHSRIAITMKIYTEVV